MSIKNWSVVPGNNTSAPPAGAPESSTKLKDMNDILREIMAKVRCLAAPATIASAATTDLGSLDETFLTVSGVTTITSFGTVSAGIYKFVTFSGALTLTHNATSLILLGGANRTTVAGDCGLYLSLGGGNWKEYFYSPGAGYQPKDATLDALAGTLTAANKIPYATALNVAGELTRSTDGTLAGNSDTNIPTEKAVKTYADTKNIATQVAPGTSGNVLTSNGTAWTSAASGGGLGSGQSWAAATITSGTTYTNSTGKPIMIKADVIGNSGVQAYVSLTINGAAVGKITDANAPAGVSSTTVGTAVIPTGATYVLTDTNVTTRTNYILS